MAADEEVVVEVKRDSAPKPLKERRKESLLKVLNNPVLRRKYGFIASPLPACGNGFTFTPSEVLFQYLYDEAFRNHVDSGYYVYANGSVVLKDPTYVAIRDGKYVFTYGARRRPGQCCLVKVKTESVLQHGEHSGKKAEEFHEPPNVSSIQELLPEVVDLILGRSLGGTNGTLPPHNFCLALKQFMKERCMTEEELAEQSSLSTKTIQRMRTDEFYQPSLESVMAVCIGLHLDPYSCYFLIDMSGNTMKKRKEAGLYGLIISMAYKSDTTVSQVNTVLIASGFQPLTKEVDKY